MAKVISTRNIRPDLKYEPGFELQFGITDETTGIQSATLVRTHFPAKSNSKAHYHSNGDLMWFHMSGPKAAWLIGKEKKEFVTEPGDFIYIPRGEIHSTINSHATEAVEGVGGYGGCGNPYKSGKTFVE
ncbi:MAG: cupin domain-containing protein [Nitrospinota bacterium]